ncbi:hypothetical protein JW905_03220 [bacterium]|nr:hypothetical protein [candidate division CSSED10-310 bacterium]
MAPERCWSRLRETARRRALDAGRDLSSIERTARVFIEEYRKDRCLKQVSPVLSALPDYGWALFYEELAASRKAGLVSPVAHRTDSWWLVQSAACFVNARACGRGVRPGTLLTAARLLPGIRAANIHLAPFFDCVFDNLYAINSARIITPDIIDAYYLKHGFTPDQQLALFIEAAHLLDKTVGFDLEPHTGQFSRVVLANPGCFRWLRLDATRDRLYDGMAQDRMLAEDVQEELAAQVADRCGSILAAHGLDRFEPEGAVFETVRRAHAECTADLIAAGYWTLPSHAWGGAGLPEFTGYNHIGDFPLFHYLSLEGEDHDKHAFGMLTPFKFYTGLPINRVPSPDAPPRRHPAAVALFTSIFAGIQQRHSFDFVRLDYADHVFDSVADGDDDAPLSDRPTPAILREAIARVRAGAPFLGVMAERMGHDAARYREIGVNLLLGTEILGNFNRRTMNHVFDVGDAVAAANRGSAQACSVSLAVDTHDSGHPLFWGRPISEIIGPEGMAHRHFISRFSSAGAGVRPKYECLGNQDLSHGLYEANNRTVNLEWRGDSAYNRRYHLLEDLYERYRDIILEGRVGHRDVRNRYAWWCVNAPHLGRSLICVAYLEEIFDSIDAQLACDIAYHPVPEAAIPPAAAGLHGYRWIREADLASGEERAAEMSGDVLVVRELAWNQCRLFILEW